MSKIFVFLFLAFLYFLNAEEENTNQGGLEWPFYMGSDGNVYTDIKIGYPEQKIQVSLNYFHQNRDLIVVPKYSGNAFFGGQYVMNASKTLNNSKNSISHTGITFGIPAQENFMIGNQNSTSMHFLLHNNLIENRFTAVLGFGIPDYELSYFWDSFYKHLQEKSVTIVYNNYPKSGIFVAGEITNKYCQNKWTTFPQMYWNYEKKEDRDFKIPSQDVLSENEAYQIFGLEIDGIIAGREQFPEAKGKKLLFKFNGEKIRWPSNMYYDMLNYGLGSKDNRTISCDSKAIIKFIVEDSYIELTPEMYLEKEGEGKLAKCTLFGVVAKESNEFSLPLSFFKHNCLSISPYDQTIGISSLKDTNTGSSMGKQKQVKLSGEAHSSSSKFSPLNLIFLLAIKLIVFK